MVGRGVECYRHWPSGDRVAYKHNAATGDGVDDAASSDPSHTIDNASRRRRRQQGHDATSASASAPAPVTATGIGTATATATATGIWHLQLAVGSGHRQVAGNLQLSHTRRNGKSGKWHAACGMRLELRNANRRDQPLPSGSRERLLWRNPKWKIAINSSSHFNLFLDFAIRLIKSLQKFR